MGVPLVLAVVLVGADRAVAAYTANTIAHRIERFGFQREPDVSVGGFPFVPQLASGHLSSVNVNSGQMRLGRVTAAVTAHAAGVALHTSKTGGTIESLTGTALIPFPELASLTPFGGGGGGGLGGGPGLTIVPAGAGEIMLRFHVAFFTLSAVATLGVTGPDSVRMHIVSAPGMPPFLVNRLQNLSLHVPHIPLGLKLRSVAVTSQGVLATVSADDVHFMRHH